MNKPSRAQRRHPPKLAAVPPSDPNTIQLNDTDRQTLGDLVIAANNARMVLGERHMHVVAAQQLEAQATQAVAEAAGAIQTAVAQFAKARGLVLTPENAREWRVDLQTGRIVRAQ